jgi:fumarylpyruvate hydrolase
VSYVIDPPPVVSVPVVGTNDRFPVHRIYCVARNYAEHAREMGATEREAPFFFMKPADAVVAVPAGETGSLPYPTLTANLHHEVELVVALARGGRHIRSARAQDHIYGYSVGLDMTRRDLQAAMKKEGRPWCIAKGFDASAPIGAITKAAQAADVSRAEIALSVNGEVRQRGAVSLIWSIGEILEHLSAAWELKPGDLIFTGTPAGVGPVVPGDTMVASVTGLATLTLRVQ